MFYGSFVDRKAMRAYAWHRYVIIYWSTQMKNLIISAVIACGLSTSAIAGNPDPVVAYVAPVVAASTTDWSGFYVGGLADFESGDILYSGDASSIGFDFEPGTGYGVFAGYNFQSGAFVYGGELSYIVPGNNLVGFSNSLFTYTADIKARAGYTMGNALLYGFVGASTGHFDDSSVVEWDEAGYNYGVGADYLITSSIFVGAEYLMRSMEGATGNGGNQISESNTQSLSVRVGYNF